MFPFESPFFSNILEVIVVFVPILDQQRYGADFGPTAKEQADKSFPPAGPTSNHETANGNPGYNPDDMLGAPRQCLLCLKMQTLLQHFCLKNLERRAITTSSVFLERPIHFTPIFTTTPSTTAVSSRNLGMESLYRMHLPPSSIRVGRPRARSGQLLSLSRNRRHLSLS